MAFSADGIFKGITAVVAGAAMLILGVTAITLLNGAIPILQTFGLNFFTGSTWNPGVGEIFESLPYLLGTLVTAAIALLIGVPLSLGIAIFLVEMAPASVRVPISYLVELLAAVPSVIFGLWGLFVLAPSVANYVQGPLSQYLGWIPFFKSDPSSIPGLNIFTAGLILAIMIIPTVASISREVISSVPNSLREAAYSIGATRWEVIRNWVISYGRSGIFGAIILGLGRAVGETMAVTMVIGNTVGPRAIPTSLFQGGQTMASIIASNARDATTSIELSAYVGIGLELVLLSIVINLGALFMVSKLLKVKGGAIE